MYTLGKWQDLIIIYFINNEIELNGRTPITRKRLKKGKFEKGENEIIDEAIDMLEDLVGDGIIQFADLAAYTTREAETLIRKRALQGCKYFMVDTFKADFDLPANSPAWQAIDFAALKLYRLAKELNAHIHLTVQVSGGSARQKYMDFTNLSGAKSMAVTASLLMLFRPILEIEKPSHVAGEKAQSLAVMCPAGLPVTLDPDKEYRIAFFGKNREGEKNPQFVFEIDMDKVKIKFVGTTIISEDA